MGSSFKSSYSLPSGMQSSLVYEFISSSFENLRVRRDNIIFVITAPEQLSMSDVASLQVLYKLLEFGKRNLEFYSCTL